MGLRFCNEAIMSLHQIWPRLEEPTPESLSPLQVIIKIEIMHLRGDLGTWVPFLSNMTSP